MNKKTSGLVGLLLVVALLLGGCGEGMRVGEMQTRTQVVEGDGADAVAVDINIGAGVLAVSGGADALLEASFAYNVAELAPEATYSGGRLAVHSSSVTIRPASLLDIGDFRNEWDLRLNDETPLAMTVEGGAGRSHLELGGLTLTRLDINGGAGEFNVDLSGSQALRRFTFNAGAGPATIDLTGDWGTDLDAVVNGGLGAITVRLPDEVGVMVTADTGLGAVHADGLTADGDVYTNDAYGASDVTLRLVVNGGVGPVRLEVE
jgi:hypothetical protein